MFLEVCGRIVLNWDLLLCFRSDAVPLGKAFCRVDFDHLVTSAW